MTESTKPTSPQHIPHICLFFRVPDKIRLVLASTETIWLIYQIIEDCWSKFETIYHDNDAVTFILSDEPFSQNANKDATMLSKKLGSRILEGLYTDGWNLISSSSLTQAQFNSNWFFKKDTPENARPQIICLSTSKSDRLQLVYGTSELTELLDQIVESYMELKTYLDLKTYGLEPQDPVDLHQGTEYKLESNLWKGVKQTKLAGRKIILQIMEGFSAKGFRLYGTANLKWTTDSMFFMKEELPRAAMTLWMLNLDRKDRLRLLNCPPSVVEIVRKVIQQNWYSGIQQEGNYLHYSIYEFKLCGNPWWAHNELEMDFAVLLITRILGTLRSHGWHQYGVLPLSRSPTAKSIFVFRAGKPQPVDYICLNLVHTSTLRVLNADLETSDKVRHIIRSYWSKGVLNEDVDDYNTQFELCGSPWRDNSVHAFTLGSNLWDGDPDEEIQSRIFMCHLLREFGLDNWNFVASGEVSLLYHYDADDLINSRQMNAESWFLARVRDPGDISPLADAVQPRSSLVDLQASQEALPPAYDDLFPPEDTEC